MAGLVLAKPDDRTEPKAFAVSRAFFESHPILTFEFRTADVDVRVEHGLGRAPAGYLVIGRSANVGVYDGANPSTDTELVLRASGSADVQVVAL